MRRLLILLFLVAVVDASPSFSGQYYLYEFSESADVTSEDLPLHFQVEKVEWDILRDLVVWGSVRNTDSKPHTFVKLTLTAKDSYGKLMTRGYTYADPHDIGPGQVGYVRLSLDLKEEPAIVEYKITGR
jgi:hypothetical protein